MRFFLVVAILFGTLYAEFIKSENIVTDTSTKLMWQDNVEVTYQEDIALGKVYCSELILNGYIDWRLPLIKELQGIMDQSGEKNFLNKKFIFLKEGHYWSDTPNVIDQNRYWYVDFQNGNVDSEAKETLNAIRCVRENK